MVRTLLAGALAGATLLAPVASAQQQVPAECTAANPCYECVMYPCYPSDWPPFLIDRATSLCENVLSVCASS